MSPIAEARLTRGVKRSLDVLWYALIVLAIAWPIATLVVGMQIPSDPDERHTDVSVFSSFSVHSDVAATGGEDGSTPGTLVMRGQGEVLYNNTRGAPAWYLSAAIPEVMGIIFLFGLFQLRKVFAQLEEGAWFDDENVIRIRKLGWIIVAYNLLLPLLQYFGGRAILDDMNLTTLGIEVYPAFQFNVLGLLTGLGIIVLAGVIREAAAIRHEQSLTI